MNDLNKLFYWHGIAADYFNYKGDHVHVPLENRLALLRSMGVDVESEPAIVKAAFSVDVAPWLHWLPRLLTHPQQEPTAFDIQLNPGELDMEFSWRLSVDGQTVGEGRFLPIEAPENGDYEFQETRFTRRKIELDGIDLAPGYYQLHVSNKSKKEQCTLAVIPCTSWQPDWADNGEKLWGVIVQLYTIRSEKDWGIGDFGDLKQLIAKVTAFGIDVIGLNPLHTLQPDIKENCSPYSPSDRRFLNPLYVDIESVAEYIDSQYEKQLQDDDTLRTEIIRLRDTSHVDYEGVKNLKYKVLEELFSWFSEHVVGTGNEREHEFEHFISNGGTSLLALGVYEAMYNRWQGAKFTIAESDEIWSGKSSTELIRKHAKDNPLEVRFHIYLQWLSESQLQDCQAYASEQGMKLGLVRDLAVGANRSGCEVLSNSRLFCMGASVGAPPDPFSDLGQNWGIPPMDSAELRQSGFKHYIELLQENMTSCGALRIDHAMSLLRLWWCPPNETAAKGAYVYYPFDDLLGLLKLESHLNRCAVIGEDLGVVPPEFRENMHKAKIFANRVFYFEKENYHYFKAPQAYDEHALAMVNNHDVPTLKSWWDGSDLNLRKDLSLFEEGVDYPQMVGQRHDEKIQACNLLKEQGLFPETWLDRDLNEPADEEIIFAILRLNSRVSSQIFVIQLEDLLLMEAPTNVPGTFKEYPNWQRKIETNLNSIFSNTKVKSLLRDIQKERDEVKKKNNEK